MRLVKDMPTRFRVMDDMFADLYKSDDQHFEKVGGFLNVGAGHELTSWVANVSV